MNTSTEKKIPPKWHLLLHSNALNIQCVVKWWNSIDDDEEEEAQSMCELNFFENLFRSFSFSLDNKPDDFSIDSIWTHIRLIKMKTKYDNFVIFFCVDFIRMMSAFFKIEDESKFEWYGA